MEMSDLEQEFEDQDTEYDTTLDEDVFEPEFDEDEDEEVFEPEEE
jgi:hypothetical protein